MHRHLFFLYMLSLKIIAMFWLCGQALPVYAWGREGHRISGQLANEWLTPRSRKALRELLGNDDLSLAATWADDYRAPLSNLYPGSGSWHFDDIPLCGKSDYSQYCPNGDCASARIAAFIKIVANKENRQEKRADALRFIVHILGDIQQPLHAADNDDRGGNEVQVLVNELSQPVKLHYLWDTILLRQQLRGMSENEFARQLQFEFKSQVSAMQSGSIADWLAESHHLAVNDVYAGLESDAKCPRVTAGRTFILSQDYMQRGARVVRVQITKAGARIASVINGLFDPR